MKVISYSLFGNHPQYGTRQLYWRLLPTTVLSALHFYPEYQVVVHHDSTYNEPCSRLLRNLHKVGLIDCRYCGESVNPFLSMLWRLSPLFSADVEIVLCRDLDSIIMPKEVKCVRQFEATACPCHCMNDNRMHTMPLMGGMVAFRSQFRALTGIQDWAQLQQLALPYCNIAGGDQMFMLDVLWRCFYDKCCEHRLAGWPQTPTAVASFTTVPALALPFDAQFLAEADQLMPFIGAPGYCPVKAMKLFDTYGDGKIMAKFKLAESMT